MKGEAEQVSLCDLDTSWLRMFQDYSAAPRARIFGSYLQRSAESPYQEYLSLDLRADAGYIVERSWQILFPWPGGCWTPVTGACPLIWKDVALNPVPRNGAGASFLSQILQAGPPAKYYLSVPACLGILRRAAERGKELPAELKVALEAQAGIGMGNDEAVPTPPDENGCLTPWDVQSRRVFEENGTWSALYGGEGGGHGYVQSGSYALNQRDEARDLHNVSAAICAQPGMKQQTFVADCLTPWDTQQQRIFTPGGQAPTLAGADGGGGRNPAGLLFSAGFCAGAAPSAGNIGYETEIAPTMKAGGSGTNMVPTILCLGDQGGQRMDVSWDVAGTLRAQMDGHPPLVLDEADSYCIMGNAIDRLPHNGGNGIGVQADIAYTMTATDRPAVFSRQRVDEFREDEIASTQAARQYKDATDVIRQPYQDTVGALTKSDSRGIGNQYVDQDKCVLEPRNLIRRLTPLEAERLQGFPDSWTDIPGASDTARYKACGNSVAIPCVEFIMGGLALNLILEQRQKEELCTDTPIT